MTPPHPEREAERVIEAARNLTKAHLDALDAGIGALEGEATAERATAQMFTWATASAAKHFARAKAISDDAELLAEVRAHLATQAGSE